MSTDEQFARRLRFEANDVPAIPVDARRILQAGRRRRQLRPVIGGAAGVLGITVAIAAFSALQPSPSAIGPAGTGASATAPGPVATATAPSQAVVDDAAAQEEQAKLEALRAELDSRVQSPLATMTTDGVVTIVETVDGTVTTFDENGGVIGEPTRRLQVPVVRHIRPDEWATVQAGCLQDAGFYASATSIGTLVVNSGLGLPQPSGLDLAAATCDAQYPIDESAVPAPTSTR